jgi:hypothetical protein
MNRILLLCALLAALGVLTAAPALAQEEMAGDGPAVVIESEPESIDEEAWTFRFLVPTLLLATVIAVPLVIVGYGVRVRGRYRVIQ